MPELPEVETVVRDLRPHLVGATITGARSSWARTSEDARRGRLRCGDRRPAGGGGRPPREADRRGPFRRCRADHPPQDDRAALRGPGRRRRGSLHPAGPRAGRRPGAALPRHPQVREDRALRTRSRHRRARHRGRGCGAVRADRARAAGPGVHAAGLPTADPPSVRAAQAAAARPVVHRGRRQHLCRRGAVAREAAPAAHREDAPPAGRAAPLRGRAFDPRRGGRAARLLDRRLHRAGRRRLDAGTPQRLPADRPAVPALRPADQAHRHRRPQHPLLLVGPAAAEGRSPRREGDPADDDRGRAADRPALDGPDRADEARRRDASCRSAASRRRDA